MSVLNCDRKGCENIMCDRLSYKFGYICDECFSELCESDMDIKTFMGLPKKIYKTNNRKHQISEYKEEFQIR